MFNRHKNIQFGIKDQQQAKEIHICSVTGHSIYEGQLYIQVENDIVEYSLDALITYLNAEVRSVGEEVEGE